MNGDLQRYLEIYDDIERNFYDQIASFGLKMQQAFPLPLDKLKNAGVTIENSCSSFWLNCISPACVSCRKGAGMTTYFISMRCPKSCYFCFNPNQENFAYYKKNLRPAAEELRRDHAEGKAYTQLALSGGEPLMHKAEAYEFLRTAKELYPDVYLRLYTCGDFLDEACLAELKALMKSVSA